jgi:hypothetical protein
MRLHEGLDVSRRLHFERCGKRGIALN